MIVYKPVLGSIAVTSKINFALWPAICKPYVNRDYLGLMSEYQNRQFDIPFHVRWIHSVFSHKPIESCLLFSMYVWLLSKATFLLSLSWLWMADWSGYRCSWLKWITHIQCKQETPITTNLKRDRPHRAWLIHSSYLKEAFIYLPLPSSISYLLYFTSKDLVFSLRSNYGSFWHWKSVSEVCLALQGSFRTLNLWVTSWKFLGLKAYKWVSRGTYIRGKILLFYRHRSNWWLT
jgi:hypothetical protein